MTAPLAPTLYLAEDDEDLRDTLAWVLRRRGYVVEEGGDGRALRDRLARAPLPALVITDVHMPGPSGLAVLEAARLTGCAVPFLVITSFGDATTHSQARALGATLLDKPLDLSELCARVAAILAR